MKYIFTRFTLTMHDAGAMLLNRAQRDALFFGDLLVDQPGNQPLEDLELS